MLAQAAAPMVTGAATYSDELQGAYDYAYSKGITTMTSIDNANMYGELTRGQLSKMISQWAEKEMWVKADETASCSFSDASTAEGDLATWVVKACQMGLMGQGINAFRPNDKVTRGEFGTVLSRAIWGDKYNQENPFYAKHLQALKDAGIMTKIEEPNSLEIRGWVMLMLQRAAETVSGDDECNDPAVLLACALGSTGCPAKCADKASEEKKDSTRVIAGDLDVSVVDYSSDVKSAPIGIFSANTLKFNASEKIQLDSLTLKRTGLGTQKSISKVWLEKNGVAVTNSASVGSDGLAVLNFKSNRDTISSATEYELVVQLADNATVGDEFAFELQSVSSTAKNTTVNGKTNTYRISSYKVVNLTANASSPRATVVEYDLGKAADYIIWEFSLESDSSGDDRDIYVKSLSFRNAGTLDFEDTFKNVKVYRDSKVVSNGVEVNGKDITVTLDQDTIKANRKAIYTIRAEVSSLEDVNKTVQLYLKDAKDIIADEYDTEFRSNIGFANPWATGLSTGYLNTYKFKGGKVTLESASNFDKTINAATGASDVTVAKGRIVVSEPVELPTLTLDISGANNSAAAADAVKRVVLRVGDKRYTSDLANGKATFTDVVVRDSADVELLVTLSTKLSVARIIIPAIKAANMSGKGSYQNNDADLLPAEIAGVITPAEIIIKTPKFTLSTDSVSTQETVINDSTAKTLMKGRLEAKDNDVNVNEFVVSIWSNGGNLSGADNPSVEVYLYIDGQPFANGTLNAAMSWTTTITGNQSWTFNSIGTIKAGQTLPYEIRVVPTVGEAQEIYLYAQAKGTDNNGNDTETSRESTATLKVKGAATIEIATTSASDRVIDPTNNVVVYKSDLDVKNSTLLLTSFTLTWNYNTSVLNMANFKLVIDGETVANNGTYTSPVLDFGTLGENLKEGKHVVEVKADVSYTSTAAAADPDKFLFTISGASANGKESNTVVKTYFAKGFFNLAKTSTSDSVLTVRLTNNSEKAIKVIGITVDDWAALATASVNNQDVTGITGSVTTGTVNPQTVSAGSSIDVQLIAKKDSTVKLKGIKYEVEDEGTYTYELTSEITSVGSWWQFYSTKG